MAVDYYSMAIKWGEEYLANNKEPKQLRIDGHTTVTNDIQFVSVCVERIKFTPSGRLRDAEYELLRKFKVFIEKVNKNIDLIEKIV